MKITMPKISTQSTGRMTADVWQLWLDGASDLVKCWDLNPSREGEYQYNRQRNAMGIRNHFGCSSEPEAREVLTKGWTQGAALVEKLAKEISDVLPPPKSRRRTRKWSDDGDEISYERLQLGQDPWLSSHRKLRSACGLIEVIGGWGSSCCGSTSQLQWSGAAALALTDLLEKADYSVELALITALGMPSYQASLVRVDLKRMGELVDLEQLAAVAVYPPAYRVYGLCAFQQGPFSSGDDFNSHPHASFQYFEPNGMWNYRPNVMTLELPESISAGAAKMNVLKALKQLDSLVNPQEEYGLSRRTRSTSQPERFNK